MAGWSADGGTAIAPVRRGRRRRGGMLASSARPHPSPAAPPSPSKGKAAAAVRNCLIQRRFEGKIAVKLRSRTGKFGTTEKSLPLRGGRWREAPDEGGRTVLTFAPNILGTTPLSPTCHPERSGTTHQKSHAPTNHCRTANPAPSGAPAGGISLAKWHHMKQRTPLFVRVP